jgi:hypothetical protein
MDGRTSISISRVSGFLTLHLVGLVGFMFLGWPIPSIWGSEKFPPLAYLRSVNDMPLGHIIAGNVEVFWVRGSCLRILRLDLRGSAYHRLLVPSPMNPNLSLAPAVEFPCFTLLLWFGEDGLNLPLVIGAVPFRQPPSCGMRVVAVRRMTPLARAENRSNGCASHYLTRDLALWMFAAGGRSGSR